MDVFGIGNVQGHLILFVVLGLVIILTMAFVLVSFLPTPTYTVAKSANDSMRKLQPDENRYFIKPSMKPHYHGNTRIGYVDKGHYGVQMFDAQGQIKGITQSEETARGYLRSFHRVTLAYKVGNLKPPNESILRLAEYDLGDRAVGRPNHRH